MRQESVSANLLGLAISALTSLLACVLSDGPQVPWQCPPPMPAQVQNILKPEVATAVEFL